MPPDKKSLPCLDNLVMIWARCTRLPTRFEKTICPPWNTSSQNRAQTWRQFYDMTKDNTGMLELIFFLMASDTHCLASTSVSDQYFCALLPLLLGPTWLTIFFRLLCQFCILHHIAIFSKAFALVRGGGQEMDDKTSNEVGQGTGLQKPRHAERGCLIS